MLLYVCRQENSDAKQNVNKRELNNLVSFCKKINLDVVGLMCIPPANIDTSVYFKELNLMNKNLGFLELSMGMSSDYLKASENLATYLRIGSSIFGSRF